MRAALFATAALAAGAYAQIELGKCDVTQSKLPEPCQLALSTKQGQTSEQLARTAVWSLWFSYDFAVDAFATSTDGTIVVVTHTSNVENVFALPAVRAQLTIGDSVPEKGRLLLQQRNLPACAAPTPAVTRPFPKKACALKSPDMLTNGCGIVVKSTLPEPLSSQEMATGLVGTLRFVFGKGASVLKTTTDGQVVLVLEEDVHSNVLPALTASPDISVGATALPSGDGQVLSGAQTCTELRDVTVPMVDRGSESGSSANTTESSSEEVATEAAQASSAQRAAAAAVWVMVVAAFAP